MKEPVVSVLMTAYNRENYIPEAIESVLASTYPDFELIVVDDGSSDRTVEIAQSYAAIDSRVKVFINEKNLGDYHNRNKAASHAKGKYLKYLDSDDLMYPHCLAFMVASMEKYPEAGYGLSANSEEIRPYPVCISPREAYLEHFNGFGHFNRSPASAIIRRDVFEEIGGFSGKRWIGDTELLFRIGNKYPLVKFTRDLVWDRQHGNQESRIEIDRKNLDLSQRMRKELLSEMLFHPDCPLSPEEAATYLKKGKITTLKTKIISWL
jgi:glycosyltransferase involved in cell wall biosynthesis